MPGQARRLTVRGADILQPDGTPIVLRGFNLLFMLDSDFERPRKDTDDLMMSMFPGVNSVRLVMIHWDDKPTELEGRDRTADCSHTASPEKGISELCLNQLEAVLRWTASKGIWAIVTARASIAAGEEYSGHTTTTVFGDAHLREKYLRMWSDVAERYALASPTELWI